MSRPIMLLLLALVASACTASTATSTADGPRVVAPAPDRDVAALEREMFDRLNRDRAGQGLPALAWDDDLADIGRGHSLDMVTADFFAHDSPNTGSLDDRLTRAGYRFGTARENLAIAPDVQLAQDGLLDSPGHRANIFSDDIGHLGIGIVRGVDPDGQPTLYVTQVFARPLPVLDPESVADEAAERLDRARTDRGLPVPTRVERLDDLAEAIVTRDGQPRADEMQRVALELADVERLPVGSVGAVSSMLYEIGDVVPDEIVRDATLVAYGVAAVDSTDEAGRPTVRVIVVLAYR